MLFNKLFTILKKKRLIKQKISEIENLHHIKLGRDEKDFIRYYYSSEQKYRVRSIGNFVLHELDEQDEGDWQRLVFIKGRRFLMRLFPNEDMDDMKQWKKQPAQELTVFAEKLFADFDDVLSSAAKAFCNEAYQLGREIEFSSLDDFQVTELLMHRISEEGKEDILGIICFYIKTKPDQSWRLIFEKDLVFHNLACITRNSSDI